MHACMHALGFIEVECIVWVAARLLEQEQVVPIAKQGTGKSSMVTFIASSSALVLRMQAA